MNKLLKDKLKKKEKRKNSILKEGKRDKIHEIKYEERKGKI